MSGLGQAEPDRRLPDAGRAGARRLRSTSTASAFSGRDVEHPAALAAGRSGAGCGGEPVERPQERGQRLAGAGRARRPARCCPRRWPPRRPPAPRWARRRRPSNHAGSRGRSERAGPPAGRMLAGRGHVDHPASPHRQFPGRGYWVHEAHGVLAAHGRGARGPGRDLRAELRSSPSSAAAPSLRRSKRASPPRTCGAAVVSARTAQIRAPMTCADGHSSLPVGSGHGRLDPPRRQRRSARVRPRRAHRRRARRRLRRPHGGRPGTRSGTSSARWRPTRSPSTAAAPACSTPTWPEREDPWVDERTGRVWIQGDLHAENFGTYMDGDGRAGLRRQRLRRGLPRPLHLGPPAVRRERRAAGLAPRRCPTTTSASLSRPTCAPTVDQVRQFVESDRDHEWALHARHRQGPVRRRCARPAVHPGGPAGPEDRGRGLRAAVPPRPGGARTGRRRARARSWRPTTRYLRRIPESKRLGSLTYGSRTSSARAASASAAPGCPAYNLLVEGHTQALENDVVLYMKQGNVAAPSRIVDDEGARATSSTRATEPPCRSAPCRRTPTRGSAGHELDGVGYVVAEDSPYEADLDWGDITEPDEIGPVLEQLGRATAKVHCVSDKDSERRRWSTSRPRRRSSKRRRRRGRFRPATWSTSPTPTASGPAGDHELFVDAFRTRADTGNLGDRALTRGRVYAAEGMATDAVGAATGVDRVQRRVVRLLSITQVLGGSGSAAASRSAA